MVVEWSKTRSLLFNHETFYLIFGLSYTERVENIAVYRVEYLEGHKVDRVVIVNEGHSLKHGTWKFYNPSNGSLIKVENYLLDELQTEDNQMKDILTVFDGVDSTKSSNIKPVEKAKTIPKELEEHVKTSKNLRANGRKSGNRKQNNKLAKNDDTDEQHIGRRHRVVVSSPSSFT